MNGPQTCPQCQKVYKSPHVLRVHMAQDCGKERRFACMNCNKVFKRKYHLSEHMKSIHRNMQIQNGQEGHELKLNQTNNRVNNQMINQVNYQEHNHSNNPTHDYSQNQAQIQKKVQTQNQYTYFAQSQPHKY